MPDDRAAVTTRVVLRSKEAVGVSLRHGGVHGDAFATLSPPILFSVGKSCGGLLATTKSTRRTISHAFVLYRELVTELSHADLDNKFADRIALICPSLPPTDN